MTQNQNQNQNQNLKNESRTTTSSLPQSTTTKSIGLGVIAIIIALISKEIIVFNEEFLILIAFIAFILTMVRTFSKMLTEEFDNRAQAISKELELTNKLKETLLLEQINNSKKEATLTGPLLNKLLKVTLNTIKQLIRLRKIETAIQVRQQVNAKLERLAAIETQEIAVYKKQLLTNFVKNSVLRFVKLEALDINKLIKTRLNPKTKGAASPLRNWLVSR